MPLIGCICAIVFPPWDGIWAWIKPLPDSVQEQVDDAISHGLDGIIVYVGKKGEPPAFYTAGWKNREEKIPTDQHSPFKIASIDKLYVAVAITKLVNDQRLSLDSTLADHFPALEQSIQNADLITIRMMLQHRSGIPNFTDVAGYWQEPPENQEAALQLIHGLPADFEAGSDYRYSNSNYLLLTKVIEEVVGYGHFQYIAEEILIPLGLTNTYDSMNDVEIADMTSGYWVGYGPDLKHRFYGSMVATAEDVGVFLMALNDGTLLDSTEQSIYRSVYEYGHSGLVPGYQSVARYHSDIDTVVVQFVNTSGGTPIFPIFDTGGGTKVMVANVVYNRIVQILRNSEQAD